MSESSDISVLLDKWQASFRKREDLQVLYDSMRAASQTYDLGLKDTTLIDVRRALDRAIDEETQLRAAVLGTNRNRGAT